MADRASSIGTHNTYFEGEHDFGKSEEARTERLTLVRSRVTNELCERFAICPTVRLRKRLTTDAGRVDLLPTAGRLRQLR